MTFVPPEDTERMDGVLVPPIEEIEAALEQVPEDLTWDWASARLFPLFECGYGEGITGDPMVNSITDLGVGIGFGIDFGPVFGRVTQSMARRWEASVEQIEHAAFTHLSEAVSRVGPADLQPVVHRGHLFRALGLPGGWASSAVLAGAEELIRIFRTRDAIFTTPSRNGLLAFGPGTPARAVAEITGSLEALDPVPLHLDPFVMEDGVLRWEGLNPDDSQLAIL